MSITSTSYHLHHMRQHHTVASMKSCKVLYTITSYYDNQAKHFVPWMEYPRPAFPDYCSGVFYIMSGQVKANSVPEIWWKNCLLPQTTTSYFFCPEYCRDIFNTMGSVYFHISHLFLPIKWFKQKLHTFENSVFRHVTSSLTPLKQRTDSKLIVVQ